MSILRCSRLYRPTQLHLKSCLTVVNNSSSSLRQYTSFSSVLYQKDPLRFDQPQRTNASASPKVIKPRFRPGDWICPSCQFHNHAHRSKCAECATTAGSLRQAQRGDWICPHCDYYNFRQRLSCKQCQELRPSPSELAHKRQQEKRQE